MNSKDKISLQDVLIARKRIAPHIHHIPLMSSASLSRISGSNIFLKLENEQVTKSFKVRGAANRLLKLSANERRRGVVTVSTGNHGKAVATMAQRLGINATVCVPELVLQHKIDAMRDIGAEILTHGADQEEAEEHAMSLANDKGMTYISPFDDLDIIAGQGTIALEILEDLPEVDHVLVPLSGGGLLSGIALAMKAVNRSIRTTGVSMDRSPVMYWSIRAGRPIQMPELPSLADSLIGGIGLGNRYTFDLIRTYMDDACLVSEDQMADAMVHMLVNERLVVEGGGSVALAAPLNDRVLNLGKNVVVVVSGGNADMPTLLKLVRQRSSIVTSSAH